MKSNPTTRNGVSEVPKNEPKPREHYDRLNKIGPDNRFDPPHGGVDGGEGNKKQE